MRVINFAERAKQDLLDGPCIHMSSPIGIHNGSFKSSA